MIQASKLRGPVAKVKGAIDTPDLANLNNLMETLVKTPAFRLIFGREATACRVDGSGLSAGLAMPVLAGRPVDRLLTIPEGGSVQRLGALYLVKTDEGEVIGGFASLPCPGPVESVARQIYGEILPALGDQALYRMWNFVPHINATVAGREQYQSFNVGRCHAFREHYGEAAMESRLPAASAVGIDEPVLAVGFLTGRGPVAFFENPHQVPAYRYPEQYGPCSPSFARGAVVTGVDGGSIGYLSGTSSIRGHETIGKGSLEAQFGTTLENIGAILERMGFADGLDPDWAGERAFRVYLRNPGDLDRVRERFASVVGETAAEADTMYLQADICRSPLLLEIEGVFAR